MNWYLFIITLTINPLPGSIAYPSPSTLLLYPAYASEAACQTDAPKRIATLFPPQEGRKYAFTCVQIP